MNLAEAMAVCPVIAITRGIRPDEAEAHAQAMLEAGIRAVEVPLNSPEPIRSLQRLAARFGDSLCLGAGTVLTADAVDQVADAGGRILVAPNTDQAVIARAASRGLEPLPGFATATEAFTAIAAGARHLKLFPAVTYGPGYVRQIRAVLPAETTVWAVGGVGPDRFSEWWAAGVRGFGIGGELYRAGQSVKETAEKAARVAAAARALQPAA